MKQRNELGGCCNNQVLDEVVAGGQILVSLLQPSENMILGGGLGKKRRASLRLLFLNRHASESPGGLAKLQITRPRISSSGPEFAFPVGSLILLAWKLNFENHFCKTWVLKVHHSIQLFLFSRSWKKIICSRANGEAAKQPVCRQYMFSAKQGRGLIKRAQWYFGVMLNFR